MTNPDFSIKLSRTLLLLVVVGLLYVTAVPFGLISPLRYAAKWARTELMPFYPNPGARLTGSDTIANILLFLPFGFFLHGWRILRRNTSSRDFLKTILLGALLSAGIEILQFFLKDRFSSINDVMFNVVGTALGAAAAHYYYVNALNRALHVGGVFLRRPALLLLAALGCGYVLWMLLPLNFTLAWHNIMRKWLQWQYSVAHLSSLSQQPYTLDLREYWLLVSIENFLYFVVIGEVYVLCARKYWAHSQRRFGLGAMLIIACLLVLSALQFCVIGGSPDVLTLISSAGGFGLGLLLMSSLAREKNRTDTPFGYGYYAEAALVIPYLLFFLLLVLRPDLPDFRVEAPALVHNGLTTNLVHDFFSRLRLSLHPEVLQQGGSAYLRLFVKLFVASLFAGAALKYFSHGFEGTKRRPLYLVGGSILFGVLAQALRFGLWGASVNLIAVIAIALGIGCAVWVAGHSRFENLQE
jgi:glycopeptide antibiotics resistance protein